jgi:hypothetical protein
MSKLGELRKLKAKWLADASAAYDATYDTNAAYDIHEAFREAANAATDAAHEAYAAYKKELERCQNLKN